VAFSATAPAAQADLKVAKNFRLPADNSGFRGKDEVGLAVNPANPQHVVATNSDYLDESCEATASFDGGATWSTAFPLQVPTPAIGSPFLPSCRVSNHAGESMFQGVTFGSGMNVYAVSITPRAAGGVEEGASVLLYKSSNGGVTWGAGIIAMPGGTGSTAATGPYYELPSVVVEPGGGTGGADLVYTVAHDSSGSGTGAVAPCPCQSQRVARSLDGGTTWGAPVIASTTAISAVDGASPALGPDGVLSLTYRTNAPAGTTNLTTPSPGEIHFVKSTDDGQTFSAPVVITNVSNLGRPSSSHVTPLSSNSSSFPRLAVSGANGSLLYVVYNQSPNPGPTAPAGGYQGADHFIPPDSAVYFQRSLNGGTTWSTPKLINDNITPIKPGTQIVQTRHPSVSVAPNGRIDIVWEDRRHWYQGPGERTCLHTHLFCDDARLGDAYYAFSGDGGATFSPNRRISDHSHNNDTGFDYRFATYWYFGPVSVPMGSDQLLVAWMDSREGSFDSDNQDIYMAKVNHAASAAVAQSTVDGGDAVGLSVALSQQSYIGGGEGLMRSGFASRNGTKVVIVNQDNSAAALAGGVLARANVGPVLLAPAGGLPASVKAEVLRLAPAGAYIVGDTGQLSAQVETDLEDAGVPLITRISGNSDARLAANIAAEFDRRTLSESANPAFDAAVIANPASPDAYAAAGLAAARRLPILYVNADSVPAATSAALTSMNINRTLVIGDASDVSTAVMASLPGTATRLGGADQYATSKAVAAESVARGLPSNVVYVAAGERPIDAALTGAAVGRTTGIMVLSPGSATAPGAAADLTGIDRYIVVKPSTVAAPPAGGGTVPPPGAGTPPPPPPATVLTCGKLKLVKSNASKSKTRVDMRMLMPCAGKLTATATVKLRVKGKLTSVRQKVSVKSLSGLNRSVRVTLTKAALKQLTAKRVLRVTIKGTFTPTTLSATSKKSTRTVNVTLRLAKKKVGT
jgi:putative cell wall-binding protein